MARTAHFALHCCALEASPISTHSAAPSLFPVVGVWLGAMVPKRWAKRAVTRNVIKRQIYSICADFEPRLSQRAHVVRLRAAFDRSQFISASSEALKTSVRAELQQLFLRATTPNCA